MIFGGKGYFTCILQFLFAAVVVLLPGVIMMSRESSDFYPETDEMEGLLNGVGSLVLSALLCKLALSVYHFS